MDIGGQTGSSSRRRFSREWFEEVRLDGDWVQPRFWRDPCYLTASPWPKKDLSLAFAALRRVYPPEVAREIFSGSQPRLRGLLIDPMAPFTSALLFFGLDAAAARVWKFPDLVGRLRSDEHFHHARLEVEVMAALLRPRVAFA